MSDKMLDCSSLTEDAFEAIKRGMELHKYNGLAGRKSYFGCVIKEDMKYLTKAFRYNDKGTLIKGGIIGAGAVWVGSKLKKHFNEYRNKVTQTLGSEIKEEEKTEEES